MSFRALLHAAAAVIAIGVAGCGGAEDGAPSPKVTVQLRADTYRPQKVKVPVGTRVTWVNASQVANTVQTPDVPEVEYDVRKLDARNKFDLHTLQPGEAQSVEFDTPGKYFYYSSFNNKMVGLVEVTRER